MMAGFPATRKSERKYKALTGRITSTFDRFTPDKPRLDQSEGAVMAFAPVHLEVEA
jgi:hypothetical protein